MWLQIPLNKYVSYFFFFFFSTYCWFDMISNCTSPTQETSQHVDVQRMAYWGDFVQTHVGLYQASGSIVVSLFNMIVDIFYIIKYYQLKKKKKLIQIYLKAFTITKISLKTLITLRRLLLYLESSLDQAKKFWKYSDFEFTTCSFNPWTFYFKLFI